MLSSELMVIICPEAPSISKVPLKVYVLPWRKVMVLAPPMLAISKLLNVVFVALVVVKASVVVPVAVTVLVFAVNVPSLVKVDPVRVIVDPLAVSAPFAVILMDPADIE